jgi:hypothetical protein
VREFNELSPSKRKRLVKKILDGYVRTFGSLPEEFVRKMLDRHVRTVGSLPEAAIKEFERIYGTELGDFSSKKAC